MFLTINSFFAKKTMDQIGKNRCIVFFMLLFSAGSFAQNSNGENYHEISIGINYDKPFGQLNWVYKSVPGVQVGYCWVDEDYSENVITKNGVNISYFQFAPKADTLYYLVSPNSYGTAVFSKYKVIRASYHFEKNKCIGNFRLIAGVDAGLAFVSYSSAHKDASIDLAEESVEGKLFLSPQAGFGYAINENITVSLNAHYNALISLGSTDPNSVSYNSNAGTYRQFASFSLIASYSF
jgi:hypothetical protein